MSEKEKYEPHRRCVGCMGSFPQDQLIRIALTADGLRADKDQRAQGRACYLCRNKNCLEIAFRKNGFSRSFKKGFSKVEIQRLREELTAIIETHREVF